ncbi:PDDEXK nuclease domain-containing protein [Rhodocaloribacter sp.]
MLKSPPGVPAAFEGYEDFLRGLKARIRTARIKAALSANREMILLYLDLGRGILEQQERAGWGKAVVERISKDLRRAFPDVKGFSARNLWDMRRLYESCRHQPDLRQLVAEIPWGHNLILMQKVPDPEQRMWYIRQVIANGWSRAILAHQIETGLYRRQVTATKTTNFGVTLPPSQSDLAREALKDPYIFDFISLGKDAQERDLEGGLLARIRDFLLELGAGFAFMGSQYPLEVGSQDFYVDLLFYHHRLRCLIAIDLKMGDFKPEYAGKMNFYLSALDDLIRHPQDAPSVGLILCRGKNRPVAEYALRDMSKPIGIAEYRLTHTLPGDLVNVLPDPGALERLIDDRSTGDDLPPP